ncbi:unnamed protein product [Brassica oleracea var. botrytis]|uniref:(rape) hypothetical protein n=1 Tax=Brassica napus TaxID=3708 RepID=A0A816JK48_BRANA|nr:unnamed protein product [Brassica napus]
MQEQDSTLFCLERDLNPLWILSPPLTFSLDFVTNAFD